MSTKKDRFKRDDNAIDQGRKDVDRVVGGSTEAGGEAREEVQEAVDDVEARSTNSETVPTNSATSTRL